MAARKGAAQQVAQTAFGSTYGKQQSNADAQIQREIARLQKQMEQRQAAIDRTVRQTVKGLDRSVPAPAKVKGAKIGTTKTPNGIAGGSNVPAYHRYP